MSTLNPLLPHVFRVKCHSLWQKCHIARYRHQEMYERTKVASRHADLWRRLGFICVRRFGLLRIRKPAGTPSVLPLRYRYPWPWARDPVQRQKASWRSADRTDDRTVDSIRFNTDGTLLGRLRRHNPAIPEHSSLAPTAIPTGRRHCGFEWRHFLGGRSRAPGRTSRNHILA